MLIQLTVSFFWCSPIHILYQERVVHCFVKILVFSLFLSLYRRRYAFCCRHAQSCLSATTIFPFNPPRTPPPPRKHPYPSPCTLSRYHFPPCLASHLDILGCLKYVLTNLLFSACDTLSSGCSHISTQQMVWRYGLPRRT